MLRHPWRRCWVTLQIQDLEWQWLQPHSNHPWVQHSPIFFSNMLSVLISCDVWSSWTWKLDECSSLVENGSTTKGLGVWQTVKSLWQGKGAFLCYNWNMTFSSTNNSSLKRLVPIFTSHVMGTTCQSNMYFFLLPLIQHLVLLRQSQFLYSTLLVEWYAFFLPLCTEARVPCFQVPALALYKVLCIDLHYPTSFDYHGGGGSSIMPLRGTTINFLKQMWCELYHPQ